MTAIGVDVGGTTIKLGAVQNGADIVFRDTRQSPRDPDKMAASISEMVREAWKAYPGAKAAISIAGGFNEAGNLNANQLGFVDVPIRRLLREHLGRDIPIENDGMCALAAEHAQGALKGAQTGILITLGTGIGGGVICGGRPYRGRAGAQAELGHMITHVDGRRCSCGQSGCWEAYASATALSEMAGGMPPRDVIEAVREDRMLGIWHRYLFEVAQGLIGLCSIFSPEVIAIGGGLSNAGSLVLDGIREAFMSDPGFSLYYPYVSVVPAAYRNDAGIIGAAALASET